MVARAAIGTFWALLSVFGVRGVLFKFFHSQVCCGACVLSVFFEVLACAINFFRRVSTPKMHGSIFPAK